MSSEDKLAIKFLTFKKGEKVFFAYYFPKEIEDEPYVDNVIVTMPYLNGQMENPVIVDLMTRKIYSVENNMQFNAPITDYPMLVVDFDMIKDIAVIDCPENAGSDTLSAFYEKFSIQKDEE